MRRFSALLAVALVAGCSGNKGNDSGDTGGGGGTTVPSIEFTDAVDAKGLSGNVDSDTILAHKSTNLLLGAVGLASADEAVRDSLQSHSDGQRTSHCWEGPLIPQSTFTLDYTPCDQVGISGGMIYNQDPLGPVSLDFRNLTFNDTRVIDGAVGMDATDAVISHWKTYDTVADLPTFDNRQAINLEVDGRDVALTYEGGAFLRALNQNIAVWGVLDLAPYGGDPYQVLVGSTDAGELTSNSEPAEPASLSWNYLSCRCPTAGLMAMDLGFDVQEITIDLDDLKTSDDGVDDPELTLDVAASVSGPVESRYVNCGEYEVTFDGSAGVEVEVSSDELKAGIQGLCDTAVIGEPGRCTALIQAADKLDSLTVTVGPNRLANSVATEASTEFDTSYCNP